MYFKAQDKNKSYIVKVRLIVAVGSEVNHIYNSILFNLH